MSDRVGKVLVIGGGAAGCTAMKGLRKANHTVEIVLVEPKDYCEALWAAYRSPFDSKTADGALYPLAPFCAANKVTQIRSTVTALRTTSATLANGDTVAFDICVVASGATMAWDGLGRGTTVVPDGALTARKAMLKAEGEAVLGCKSVLIVGGGLVGAELAGDVAAFGGSSRKRTTAPTTAPPIQVTLVHATQQLCPEVGDTAATMIQAQLETAGVTVVLNERVVDATTNGDKNNGTTVTLSSGRTLSAEKVIWTTGITACNDFIKTTIPSAVNGGGFLNTDEYFRVAGTGGTIFGIGDCCVTVPNSFALMVENLKIIGGNVDASLQAVLKGTPLVVVDAANNGHDGATPAIKLKPAALGSPAMVVTTGPKSGVFYSTGMTTKRFIPYLKNKSCVYSHVSLNTRFCAACSTSQDPTLSLTRLSPHISPFSHRRQQCFSSASNRISASSPLCSKKNTTTCDCKHVRRWICFNYRYIFQEPEGLI